MPEWDAPLDYQNGAKLRARNLNHDLFENVAWLKDRPYDIKIIQPQSADLSVSNLTWQTLGPNYQLELVLPDVCNVLLCARFTILMVSNNHNIGVDWVRDDNYWLSSADGTKPVAETNGLGLIGNTTSIEDNVNLLWWDVDVPPGRHTYDLAFAQSANSFNIIQSNVVWQLFSMGW